VGAAGVLTQQQQALVKDMQLKQSMAVKQAGATVQLPAFPPAKPAGN
jgi:hypothetical protein